MVTFAEVQQTDEWQRLGLPAEQYYRDKFPYHNWTEHILPAVEDVVALAERCNARGIHMPVGRLAVAMAWHDARDFENPALFSRASSEEAYSAQLLKNFLRAQSAPELYTKHAYNDILGTQHLRANRSRTMMVMHWADVANIGKPYEFFAPKSAKLYAERRMSKPDLTLSQYVAQTRNFIQALVAESLNELPHIGEPTQGETAFPVVARLNSERLATETEASLLEYGLTA